MIKNKIAKQKTPPNPHARKIRVIFRVNNTEMHALLVASSNYADLSEYCRAKCLPKEKGKK